MLLDSAQRTAVQVSDAAVDAAYGVGRRAGELLSVAKLNIDDFPEIAEREGVEVIPTLILYRDGKALGRIVAPDSKGKIDDFIRETLGGTV